MEKKSSYKLKRVEFVLLIVLGFLVGVALKTEAGKRIVIGFDDYKASAIRQDVNLNQLQREVAQKAQEEQAAAEEQNPDQQLEGASCSQ